MYLWGKQWNFAAGYDILNYICTVSYTHLIERSMDELLPFGFGPSNVAGNAAVEK